jgi:hypothetical protein
LRFFFIFGNTYKYNTADKDCTVDVEEFSSPKISRNSWLWQHCEVKNGAKGELL